MNSTVYAVDEYGNEAEDVRSGYVGEFKKFGFSGVPKHCLACDGSEISRATYSELFEVFGETYGAGDGETTFNLPDFRGAFLRCAGGNAATLGVKQGDAMRKVTGIVNFRTQIGADGTIGALIPSSSGCFVASPGKEDETAYGIAQNNAQIKAIQTLTFDSSFAGNPTAAENRPINYAVNVCVVYE